MQRQITAGCMQAARDAGTDAPCGTGDQDDGMLCCSHGNAQV